MDLKILALAFSVLVLSGCTSKTGQAQKDAADRASVRPGEVIHLGPIQVGAPAESGWASLQRNDSLIAFGKFGGLPKSHLVRESYVASVWLVPLRDGANNREFLERVRAGLSVANDERHKYLRSEESLSEQGDTTEVWNYTLVEDHGPGGTAQGKDAMLLELYSYARRLPLGDKRIVMSQYSYRHYAESVDLGLATKAKNFLAGVRPSQ